MGNDYLKKEPSKTEKMLYELAMQQHQMDRALWATSAHVVSLGILLGAEPEKIAELMVNGDEKLKEYSKKVNEAIKKLEEAKAKEHSHSHEGHDHGHDHNHNDNAGSDSAAGSNQQ